MSRPEIPIDWKRVDELLTAGCLGTEVAAYLGMHPDTFYHRVEEKHGMGFSEYFAGKKSNGNALLREAQYTKAMKKSDNTMLIWLGKQRLGQKENSGEMVISDDVLKAFNELMSQVDKAQSERKYSSSQAINADKSDCVAMENCPSDGRDSIFR